MNKATIAVDIDDVLAANVPAFIEFSNRRWGTNLTVDDYDEHWGKLWKVGQEEWNRRAIEYHDSGAIGRLAHFAEALPILKDLTRTHKLVITTSRRTQVNTETRAWLDTHFRGIFEEIHFAGMWDKVSHESNKATKVELCKQIGADFLIDDQLKHCIAAAESGIPALLFGNYPWNRHANLPANVTRVDNWGEVSDYFNER